MTEKYLNRILVKSIKEHGWGYKISDDAGDFTGTVKKPFDYLGCTNKFFIYGESKMIKDGLYAFNFKRIEPHQFDALLNCKKAIQSMKYVNFHTVVSVGFWKPRVFFYVMFFDIISILRAIENGRKSIKKKELEAIIADNQYLNIKKGLVVDIETLSDKIIYDFSPYLL